MIKKTEDTVLYFSIGILSILYIMRDVLGVPVPEFAFVGIALYAFAFLKPGHALGFYIYTSLLILPGNPIRLIYILSSLFYLERKGKMRISIPVLVLFTLSFFTIAIYSQDGIGGTLYNFVERILYIIIPMLWLSDVYTARDLQRAAKCFVGAAVFAYAVYLYMTIQGQGIERFMSSGFRFGFTTGFANNSTMASSYNANALATTSVIAISYLCVLYELKTIGGKTAVLLSIPLSLYAFFSRSRTGLLCMGLLIVLYMTYLSITRGKIKQGFGLLVIVTVFLGVIYRYFPSVLTAFMDRFEAEDITNGRSTINGDYIQLMLRDPKLLLLGYGYLNYVSVAQTALTIVNTAHNAFVDTIMCVGLTGTSMVVAFCIELIGRVKRKIGGKIPFIMYFPFLLEFVAIQGGQYLSSGLPHIKLSFSLLFLLAIRSETEN